MNRQLTEILTGLGLTEKEAQVFLACTKEGTSPASTIAKSAKINRVTTYDILEKLKQKGLISSITKNKTKYFSGINPETLLEEYENKTQSLKAALPKLKALSGNINHPRVRYFEGLEGIKTIYNETLNSKTEILNFSNSKEIRKAWPSYDQDYVEKRAQKRIYLRGLAPQDRAGKSVQSQNLKYHREIRLLPETHFQFTNEINIYEDKVAIISFKEELIGMIIESHEIAESQKAIFNICWQFSETFNQNEDIRTSLLKPIKDQIPKKDPENSTPSLF